MASDVAAAVVFCRSSQAEYVVHTWRFPTVSIVHGSKRAPFEWGALDRCLPSNPPKGQLRRILRHEHVSQNPVAVASRLFVTAPALKCRRKGRCCCRNLRVHMAAAVMSALSTGWVELSADREQHMRPSECCCTRRTKGVRSIVLLKLGHYSWLFSLTDLPLLSYMIQKALDEYPENHALQVVDFLFLYLLPNSFDVASRFSTWSFFASFSKTKHLHTGRKRLQSLSTRSNPWIWSIPCSQAITSPMQMYCCNWWNFLKSQFLILADWMFQLKERCTRCSTVLIWERWCHKFKCALTPEVSGMIELWFWHC